MKIYSADRPHYPEKTIGQEAWNLMKSARKSIGLPYSTGYMKRMLVWDAILTEKEIQRIKEEITK